MKRFSIVWDLSLLANKIPQFLYLYRCLFYCLPQPITDKDWQLQQRFFYLFHLQKKFSETTFTKLLSNPILDYTTGDSTNYFSVLYSSFQYFLKVITNPSLFEPWMEIIFWVLFFVSISFYCLLMSCAFSLHLIGFTIR